MNISFHSLRVATLAILLVSQIHEATALQAPRLSAAPSSHTVLSSAPPVFQSSITDFPATVLPEPLSKQATSNNVPLPLGTILRMLPKESFDIDTKTGLFYFGVDLVAVGATLGFLNAVVTSDVYHSIPIWGQALTVAPLQILVSAECSKNGASQRLCCLTRCRFPFSSGWFYNVVYVVYWSRCWTWHRVQR